MKLIRWKVWLLLVGILIISSIACQYKDGNELIKRENSNNLELIFLLQNVQSQGNCNVSVRQNEVVSKTCNRRIRALCNSQIAILTQPEINLLLLDQNSIRKKFSNCTESLGFSGILTLRPSTQSEIDTISQNNKYESVDSCEGAGFSSTKRIATSQELSFLQTAKGRIGQGAERIITNRLATQASKDSANLCLSEAFLEEERTLLRGLTNGEILLEFPKN